MAVERILARINGLAFKVLSVLLLYPLFLLFIRKITFFSVIPLFSFIYLKNTIFFCYTHFFSYLLEKDGGTKNIIVNTPSL